MSLGVTLATVLAVIGVGVIAAGISLVLFALFDD
jgi:hypothetical protein